MKEALRYRMLEEGEVFVMGDEALQDNWITWKKIPLVFMKCTFSYNVNLPTRRAIQ